MINIKTIILNNEVEFRNYINSHKLEIKKLYLFHDKLDNIIYFYCILLNNTIIATKEIFNNNYSYYKNIYIGIISNHNFIMNIDNDKKVLKLIKKT